ncbi:MAG: Sua5/YciO/YrdC/YwlC family protein, partial [Candidatus Zixiibacteriota bacterium]
AILDKVPFNLTATSANLSGMAESETVGEIAGIFGDGVDLYLDGGRLNAPLSTVADCSGDSPAVVRRGAIADREIIGE